MFSKEDNSLSSLIHKLCLKIGLTLYSVLCYRFLHLKQLKWRKKYSSLVKMLKKSKIFQTQFLFIVMVIIFIFWILTMFQRMIMRGVVMASAVLVPMVSCKTKREVYIWGNGSYQARPDALLQFYNFTPKKINNLPDDLDYLAFGEYYEGGIDIKGNLYIWEKKSIDANFEEKTEESRQQVKMIEKDVKSMRFTNGFIWALGKNGKVYQWPIIKKFDAENNVIGTQIGKKREVEPLRGTTQLETGRDHVVALNGKGEVFAMGDDTYGQCGQAESDRNTCPPYTEKRITYPVKVKNISNIQKLVVGADHTLAFDGGGNLYGWGSNSVLQLSHEQEFSKMNAPLLCTYAPLRFTKNLDHAEILDIGAGDEFSVIVTENRKSNSYEVFSCGSNLRGQLGINQVRHLKDIERIEDLSNFVIKDNNQEKKVRVQKLQCGKNHCLALLNIGYVMEWGDNQYGQMGNKKRAPCLSPIVLKNFIDKKVIGVFAGDNSSGVIIEKEQK